MSDTQNSLVPPPMNPPPPLTNVSIAHQLTATGWPWEDPRRPVHRLRLSWNVSATGSTRCRNTEEPLLHDEQTHSSARWTWRRGLTPRRGTWPPCRSAVHSVPQLPVARLRARARDSPPRNAVATPSLRRGHARATSAARRVDAPDAGWAIVRTRCRELADTLRYANHGTLRGDEHAFSRTPGRPRAICV